MKCTTTDKMYTSTGVQICEFLTKHRASPAAAATKLACFCQHLNDRQLHNQKARFMNLAASRLIDEKLLTLSPRRWCAAVAGKPLVDLYNQDDGTNFKGVKLQLPTTPDLLGDLLLTSFFRPPDKYDK